MSRCLVRFSVLIIVLAFGQGLVLAQIIVGGNGSNTTDSTVYSGSQSLVKTGSNTVTLSGNNTYTGKTTINAGTLVLGAGSSILLGWKSDIDINNGSTLSIGGSRFDLSQSASARTITFGSTGGNTIATGTGVNVVDWAGNTYRTTGGARNFISGPSGFNINAGATATLDVARGTDATSDLTVSLDFWNAGNIAKTGTGILTLSGANTYTGTTTISAGTLRVGDGGTTGGLGTGHVTNNATLVVDRNNSYVLSNTISGSGSLVQAGTGTTTISGNNTFTGGTTVNAGTLMLGAAQRLADTGALTLNGGTFNLGGFSELVGAVTLAGGSITNGTLIGSSYDLRSGNVAAVLAGSGALTKSTTNTVTLYAGNSYTGGTTINAGTLALGANNRLAYQGALTVNLGGTFDLGGFDQEVSSFILAGGALSGTGTLSSGIHNLQGGTINANLGGGVATATAGTTALIGNLNSMLTVSGGTVNAAGTIAGDTTVNGGNLNLSGNGRLSQYLTTTVSSGNFSTGGNETINRLVATGGTVDLTGDTLTVTGKDFNQSSIGSAVTLTGGTISVKGTLGYQASSATTDLSIESGGILFGAGTSRALTLNRGGLLSVGNSPGLMAAASANWEGGSTFQFEISNATGVAGTGWDLFSVTGELNLGGISSSNKMLLNIRSMSLLNYDVYSEYSWVFAQAATLAGTEGWASGLDVTDRFTIDSNDFYGGTQNGLLAVVTGTSEAGLATLSIKAVPEPSSGALLVIGMGALAALKRRRAV